MLFNSLQFLVFFLCIYSLYLVLGHRAQNLLLLVASYVFYCAWDYRFLFLLLLSTFIDYFIGLRIVNSTSQGVRKRLILSSIIFHLGVLGFFKYFNFFADGLIGLFALFGFSVFHSTLNVVLPLGISFYTFVAIGYLIDVYRGSILPCQKFLDFALFIAFFPPLLSGPIGRSRLLIPQIQEPRVINLDKLASGFFLIIWGLFKKVVIADNLRLTVNEIFAKSYGFNSGEVFIAALFFTFQIYSDFSGYTDIARGISSLMGFELMLNFNLPYFARNPSDFWRRWHISLSTWLRDYLYIPLGGNRGGNLKTYRNLMLTMSLGGLWHGAAWNYVFWGIYHGIVLSVHRFLGQNGLVKPDRQHGFIIKKAITYGSIVGMFMLTLYGWLLFRADSLMQIVNMTMAFANFSFNGYVIEKLAKFLFYTWPLLLVQLWQYYSSDLSIFTRSPMLLQTAIYTLLLFLIIVLGNFDGASFIYSQF